MATGLFKMIFLGWGWGIWGACVKTLHECTAGVWLSARILGDWVRGEMALGLEGARGGGFSRVAWGLLSLLDKAGQWSATSWTRA